MLIQPLDLPEHRKSNYEKEVAIFRRREQTRRSRLRKRAMLRLRAHVFGRKKLKSKRHVLPVKAGVLVT